MWKLFAVSGIMLLVSCAVAPPPSPSPQPSSRQDTTNLTRRFQNNWARCLNQSYQVTRTQTPDKNAAAEMAFQACSAEEQDLASLPYTASVMPHLKAEMKHVLIDEGHLSILPEQ
jgi:hypothetical protein